jgi:diaminopimelate decarboxylase
MGTSVGSQKAELEDVWPIIEEAATNLGTPLFVYLPCNAERAYGDLKDGLQKWGESAVAFSVKTNPFFRLLQDLRTWGAYAEVVSMWEYQLALNAGFPSERIVFNGPLKPVEALRFATTQSPLTINIDSPEELDALDEISRQASSIVRLGIRICPPRQKGVWSRFGLQVHTTEARDAILRIRRNRFFKLAAIHFHLGTQINDPENYVKAIGLARTLWEMLDLDSDVWLDIGGGFPYQHDKPLNAQSFRPSTFFAALAKNWGDAKRPRLLVEPGRFITAPAFILVSRVLAHKQRDGEPTVIVLDSGTNHNVMAAFFEHQWDFRHPEPSAEHFRLCGPLCMEDDILSGDLHRQPPKRGTLVAMLNAGAYSISLSRTFIQARPPIIMLKDTGYEVLLRREAIETAYALSPLAETAGRDG